MASLRTVRGFTLMELVLVTALLGILAASSAPIVVASMKAYNTTSDAAATMDRLRYASDRMAFEIRELTAGSITTMAPTAFSFNRMDYAGTATSRTVTIDQRDPTNVTVNGVSVNQCDGELRLSYSAPAMTPLPSYRPVLADRLCALAFTYYDQGGAVTTAAANVRYVEFILSVKSATANQSYSQRTRIGIRNR